LFCYFYEFASAVATNNYQRRYGSNTALRNYPQTSFYMCAGDGYCLNTNQFQSMGNILCTTNYQYLDDAIRRCNSVNQNNEKCDGYISYSTRNGERYELVNRARDNNHSKSCYKTNSFLQSNVKFTQVRQSSRNENRNSYSSQTRKPLSNYLCAGDGACLTTNSPQTFGNVLCTVNYQSLDDALRRCNSEQNIGRCDGYISYYVKNKGKRYELVNRAENTNFEERCQKFRRTSISYAPFRRQNSFRSHPTSMAGNFNSFQTGNDLTAYNCAGDGDCLNTNAFQSMGNVLCTTTYRWLDDAIRRCNLENKYNGRCDGYISFTVANKGIQYELVNIVKSNDLQNKCQKTNSFRQSNISYTEVRNAGN